jgi:hypothetical protein
MHVASILTHQKQLAATAPQYEMSVPRTALEVTSATVCCSNMLPMLAALSLLQLNTLHKLQNLHNYATSSTKRQSMLSNADNAHWLHVGSRGMHVHHHVHA